LAQQAQFEAILTQLRLDAAAIRKLRNRVLSHRDLAAALRGGQAIAAVRANEVQVALRHLADALNLFERAVGKPTYMYREFIHTDSHRRLLRQLKKAWPTMLMWRVVGSIHTRTTSPCLPDRH
jgi:hypothetical protein